MVTLIEAVGNIQKFEQGSLTNRISTIESTLQNADKAACKSLFQALGMNPSLLDSAFVLKRAAGQINVLIHAGRVNQKVT